ncbi:MAG: hypothetical protein ACRD9R_10630 [Pyrinomonadaceae bacterium]
MNATRLFAAALVCCALCGLAQQEARAQEQNILPPQPAPPPMRYVPEADRAQLNAARDNKARTRLSLTLAEAHLVRAEQYTGSQSFDAAAAALGVYQGLMNDALRFLKQSGKSDGKTRDLYKRLEQALYKHASRIETMRRTTPPEYTGNLRTAIKFAQDARSAALDAFYGHTVLREEPGNAASSSGEERPKGAPPPPSPL